MPPKAHVTFNEILTQTAAWEDAIRVVNQSAADLLQIDLEKYEQVIAIGCGSTYYLSLSAANIFQSQTGRIVRALPSSELLEFPEDYYGKGKNLLIAISRSGSTSETLHVVKEFKRNARGDVILITNYPDAPLVPESNFAISICAGQEISVAQTRSFASMLVAVTYLARLWKIGKNADSFTSDLIKAGGDLISKYENVAREIGDARDLKQIFFLGSGARYGLACEASLKMKEMSQTVCEPFHFMEFRHGPISMVDEKTLVVGLLSEKARPFESAVLEDVRKLGARLLTIGEENADVEFKSGLPEELRHVLYLPALQMAAYFRAVAAGKNPDIPQNLTAVVKLDIG